MMATSNTEIAAEAQLVLPRRRQRSDSYCMDGDEVVASPCGRFSKSTAIVGSGSFKTVYKGLDTETGVSVAWCELQVRMICSRLCVRGRAFDHRFLNGQCTPKTSVA